MCGGGGGSSQQTTTQQQSPPPQMSADYQALINRATGVANTPYTPYPGEQVAPLSYQTLAGLGGIDKYANAAQPWLTQAGQMTQNAAAPVSPDQYSGEAMARFMNPFTANVVDTTQREFQNQNEQQAQFLNSQNIGSGAFGGDRAGVSQAILAGQQKLAQDPVIAGLNQSNWNQALAEFNTQQQTKLAADQFNRTNLGSLAAQYGNLGLGSQQAGLQGATGQVTAGTVPQTEQQAIDTALQNMWTQGQAYPFQGTGWLGNIIEGIGSQSGGTSTTTAPAPSSASQGIGLATAGLGLLAHFLPSDARFKENMRPVGKTFDGQTIYSYNFRGDPRTTIGLEAHEVEGRHPEAVSEGLGGLKYVDYDAATRESERAGFEPGGDAEMRTGWADGGAPGFGGGGLGDLGVGKFSPAGALAMMGVPGAGAGTGAIGSGMLARSPAGTLFGGGAPPVAPPSTGPSPINPMPAPPVMRYRGGRMGFQGGGGLGDLMGWSPYVDFAAPTAIGSGTGVPSASAGVANSLFYGASGGKGGASGYNLMPGMGETLGPSLPNLAGATPGTTYKPIDYQRPGEDFQTAGAEKSLAGLLDRPGIETPVTENPPPPPPPAPTPQAVSPMRGDNSDPFSGFSPAFGGDPITSMILAGISKGSGPFASMLASQRRPGAEVWGALAPGALSWGGGGGAGPSINSSGYANTPGWHSTHTGGPMADGGRINFAGGGGFGDLFRPGDNAPFTTVQYDTGGGGRSGRNAPIYTSLDLSRHAASAAPLPPPRPIYTPRHIAARRAAAPLPPSRPIPPTARAEAHPANGLIPDPNFPSYLRNQLYRPEDDPRVRQPDIPLPTLNPADTPVPRHPLLPGSYDDPNAPGAGVFHEPDPGRRAGLLGDQSVDDAPSPGIRIDDRTQPPVLPELSGTDVFSGEPPDRLNFNSGGVLGQMPLVGAVGYAPPGHSMNQNDSQGASPGGGFGDLFDGGSKSAREGFAAGGGGGGLGGLGLFGDDPSLTRPPPGGPMAMVNLAPLQMGHTMPSGEAPHQQPSGAIDTAKAAEELGKSIDQFKAKLGARPKVASVAPTGRVGIGSDAVAGGTAGAMPDAPLPPVPGDFGLARDAAGDLGLAATDFGGGYGLGGIVRHSFQEGGDVEEEPDQGAPTAAEAVGGRPTRQQVLAYNESIAPQHGLNPKVVTGVLSGEMGGRDPYEVGDAGSSFNPWQFHIGGVNPNMPHAGMGDDYRRATGHDPGDPQYWKEQSDFAQSQMAKQGLTPWTNTMKRLGLNRWSARVNGDQPAEGAQEAQAFTSAPGGGFGTPGQEAVMEDAARSPDKKLIPSNVADAIMAAGFGMMAGTSPNAMTNIGQGALAGMNYYQKQRVLDKEWEKQDAEIRNLGSEASYRNAQTALEINKLNLEWAKVGYAFGGDFKMPPMIPVPGMSVPTPAAPTQSAPAPVAAGPAPPATAGPAAQKPPIPAEAPGSTRKPAGGLPASAASTAAPPATKPASEAPDSADSGIPDVSKDPDWIKGQALIASGKRKSILGTGFGEDEVAKGQALVDAANKRWETQKAPILKYQEEIAGETAKEDGKIPAQMVGRRKIDAQLKEMQNIMLTFQPEHYAEQKTAIAGALSSIFGPDAIPQGALDNAASTQRFLKDQMNVVMNQTREMGGRILASEIETFKRAVASPNMQPAAAAGILAQMRGLLKWQDAHDDAYSDWRDAHPIAPKRQFERQWLKQKDENGRFVNDPEAYITDARHKFPYKGQTLPPTEQREVGQAYMTPKGPRVWRGTGWAPFQAQ